MGSVLSTQHATQAMQNFLFPVEKRKTQKCNRENEDLQHCSNAPVIDYTEMPEYCDRQDALTPTELAAIKTPQGLVDLNEEGTEQTVHRRVALFFLQSIVCHKMPFHFENKGSDSQLGQAPKLVFTDTSGEQVVLKREAAHPGTTPCLIAYSKVEWDAYQQKLAAGDRRAVKPTSFNYLKGSYNHLQNNATQGVSDCVNGADELVDGKTSYESKLRGDAIAITNLVAGGLDPIESTNRFLDAYERRTVEQANRLKPQDPRRLVLNAYTDNIRRIKDLAKDPDFFNKLLGVKLDPNDPKAEVLQELVHKKRYEIIRLAQVVESRISKRVEDFRKTIVATAQRGLLEIALIQKSSNQEKTKLTKLFCKTSVVSQGFQRKVDGFATKYKTRLNNLMRDIRHDCKELADAESTFRSGLFKGLRQDYKKWRQVDFSDRYKELFKYYAMSPSMVSRLEQRVRPTTKPIYLSPLGCRRKEITIDAALRYAQTFGVDAGLFMPSLFSSEE